MMVIVYVCVYVCVFPLLTHSYYYYWHACTYTQTCTLLYCVKKKIEGGEVAANTLLQTL